MVIISCYKSGTERGYFWPRFGQLLTEWLSSYLLVLTYLGCLTWNYVDVETWQNEDVSKCPRRYLATVQTHPHCIPLFCRQRIWVPPEAALLAKHVNNCNQFNSLTFFFCEWTCTFNNHSSRPPAAAHRVADNVLQIITAGPCWKALHQSWYSVKRACFSLELSRGIMHTHIYISISAAMLSISPLQRHECKVILSGAEHTRSVYPSFTCLRSSSCGTGLLVWSIWKHKSCNLNSLKLSVF